MVDVRVRAHARRIHCMPKPLKATPKRREQRKKAMEVKDADDEDSRPTLSKTEPEDA